MREESATRFVEANALLAVMDEDFDMAREIIAGMYPGERQRVINAAHKLADLCQLHQSIVSAATGPCWNYSNCKNGASAYFMLRGVPAGVCMDCRETYIENGYTIFPAP